MSTKFINPSLIVAQAGILAGQTVADLGCGSGFYVLPAAQLVGTEGTVYAVDIVESKLAATISIVNQFGYKNVRVVRADLTQLLTDIPEGSCDVVIAGNILHEISSRDMLIKNIYRILKTGGRVLAIEWKKELSPLGTQAGTYTHLRANETLRHSVCRLMLEQKKTKSTSRA